MQRRTRSEPRRRGRRRAPASAMTGALIAAAMLLSGAAEARAQTNVPASPRPLMSRTHDVQPVFAGSPAPARAFKGDPVWEGVVIGGAIAAVSGFIVMPYALCGSNDSECSVIVRAAVGLPLFAGGLVLGGLVDKFHVRGPVVWRDESGRKTARIGTFPTGGAGVQLSVRFK